MKSETKYIEEITELVILIIRKLYINFVLFVVFFVAQKI